VARDWAVSDCIAPEGNSEILIDCARRYRLEQEIGNDHSVISFLISSRVDV
jgi:hypothetical protein